MERRDLVCLGRPKLYSRGYMRIVSLLIFIASFAVPQLGALDLQTETFESIATANHLDKEAYLSLFDRPSFRFQDPHEFAVVSIPKSGTYLVAKLLSLMTGQLPKWRVYNYKYVFTRCHFWNEETIKELGSKKNVRLIIPCRDPRDIAVSAACFFSGCPSRADGTNGPAPVPVLDAVWQTSTFDEKLSLMIGHPRTYLKSSFEQLFAFAQRADVYLCRFENLVGPNGEGSLEKQKAEIICLAEFVNVRLTPAQINYLCANIYGNTYSFREGKIGAWKNSFTEEHKALFKRVMGESLVQLGYESNNDW